MLVHIWGFLLEAMDVLCATRCTDYFVDTPNQQYADAANRDCHYDPSTCGHVRSSLGFFVKSGFREMNIVNKVATRPIKTMDSQATVLGSTKRSLT